MLVAANKMISNSKLWFLSIILLIGACSVYQNIGFEQVYVGRNGPGQAGAALLVNEDDLRKSWLSRALLAVDFERVQSRVDFSRQSLLLLSVGARKSFSGTIRVVDVYQIMDSKDRPLNITANVGVLGDGCQTSVVSHPFVVVIIDKPTVDWVAGFHIENFDDGC